MRHCCSPPDLRRLRSNPAINRATPPSLTRRSSKRIEWQGPMLGNHCSDGREAPLRHTTVSPAKCWHTGAQPRGIPAATPNWPPTAGRPLFSRHRTENDQERSSAHRHEPPILFQSQLAQQLTSPAADHDFLERTRKNFCQVYHQSRSRSGDVGTETAKATEPAALNSRKAEPDSGTGRLIPSAVLPDGTCNAARANVASSKVHGRP